jgi:thiol-disulfide isomerase/thioredoxin
MLGVLMNKKITILAIAILALIGVATGYLLLTSSESAQNSNEDTTTKNTQKQSEIDSEPVSASTGRYVTYSDNELEASKNTTRLLFFHAPWCPQCRALEADIESNTIPENVTILKVDYDSNQDLRSKYGVTLQTTIVKIDENGELDKKFVAYDEPTLASVEKNLLK